MHHVLRYHSHCRLQIDRLPCQLTLALVYISSAVQGPAMKPHLSNIPLDCIFMIFVTAINKITICLTLVAALEIRGLRAHSERRFRNTVQKQFRSQARQAARRVRRGHADVSTQRIQVPNSPNGRRFLPLTPARQHTVDRVSDSTVSTTLYADAVSSSTDPYPSSCPTAFSSMHPSFVDAGALSGGTLLVGPSNLSGATLVGTASSDSESVRSRPAGRSPAA